jgi:hypothetical protein
LKKLFLAAVFAIGLALLPASVAASTTVSTGISGYEVFPGIPCGLGATCGATFLGWTNAPNSSWTKSANGGWWGITINYTGNAGTAVVVASGKWAMRTPTGAFYSGSVGIGSVNWLVNGTCGSVNGTKNAKVDLPSLKVNGGGTGAVDGCLNDKTTFPPKVWGNVSLATP